MAENIIQITLKGVDKSSAAFKKSEKAADKLSASLSKFAKVAVAGAVAAIGALIVSSVKLAARVETLGIVVDTLGSTAGYTKGELEDLEESIRSQGITTQNTRQAMAQMIQAEIDLAHGADLARIAQDNAVIANINSSEAFGRLVTILQTGDIMMGRTMGLTLDFAGAQKELADDLGKTVKQLTEQEVMQARLNEVRKAGIAIEGTYEAAMGTSGKMMSSLARLTEELQLLIGEQLLPEFSKLIEVLYGYTKYVLEFNRAFDLLDETTRYTAKSFLFFEYIVDDTGRVVANTADEIIELAEEQRRATETIEEGAAAMVAHQASFTGYGVILDDITGKTNAFAEAERSVALALGEVTQATLAKEALEGLNQAWEEQLISEEDYKAMYQDVAANIAGLDEPAIAAHLALFDLNQDFATGMIPISGYTQELVNFGIEIGALPDYKQIKIDMLITRIEAGGAILGEEPIEATWHSLQSESDWQHGGSLTVPPGFPRDSYLMGVTSGERVDVTRANQTSNDNRDQRSFFEGVTMNFNRPIDEEVLLEQIRRIAG